MADINVDVILPAPINVDVTSPTQAVSANVSIPGPQGPRGEAGASMIINGLSGNLNITGADGISILSTGGNILTVSGNSGYFENQILSVSNNLISTGSNLTAKIDNLSGYVNSQDATINTKVNDLSGLFTGYTGTLDATYATDAQLISTGHYIDALSGNLILTGNNLQSRINTLSGNLISTGSQLESKINLVSGNLISTGSQLQSQINDLSGNLISTGSFVDSKVNTVSGNLISTGNYLESKIDIVSGSVISAGSYLESLIGVVSGNLISTGANLQTQIDNLDNTYATDTQLQSTGISLTNSINSLSGTLVSDYATILNLSSTGANLQNQIDNLDNNYATDAELISTGNYLEAQINQIVSTGYIITGIADSRYVNVTGDSMQGNLQLDENLIVLKTGFLPRIVGNNTSNGTSLIISGANATLDGNEIELIPGYSTVRNFRSRILPKGNIVFNSGETDPTKFSHLIYGTTGVSFSELFRLSQSGAFVNTNYHLYVSGKSVLTGVDLTPYALNANLISTGEYLLLNLSSLSGDFTSYTGNAANTYATIINLASTGSTLDSKINSLSGYSNNTFATITNLELTGNTLTNNLISTGNSLNSNINSLSGTLTSTYATINNLQNTGATLDGKINTLSGYVNSQDSSISNNLVSTGATLTSSINSLTSNLISTGQTLDTKINNLSGSSVLLYGNQTIDGIKTFRDAVYIHDLYVTGAEFIATTENNFIQSPYLLLNLTGGAFDGGIFFVTGSGLTGINDLGPIIGFDHSDKFKFGISSRASDLSTLNDIAAFQDITAYSGFVDGKYATIINLASTGSTLQNNINTVSSNLIITGNTLQNSINSLSGYSNSTFATITNLASTGSTLQTNINNVSSNLVSTGNTLEGKISSLSGTLTSTYATISNLASTGSTLNTKIDNLSGYINSSNSNIVFTTGNQTISGVKTFINDINISGTGAFDALSVQNKKLTSYAYNTGNFTFNSYLNIVNSNNSITGTLPSSIESGINYYIKNVNTGILLITGASNRLIDGFSTVNLYKNESLHLMGVNNVGYTGWVTLSLGGGVS